ncbi:hypothetical protein HRI_001264700 [Hibiscus trionum]|uniref:NAC domain-containing protein n=1 Tax=Hibiscus trionum TaxID=183268 RepID=A0A9W7HHK8_HIBTR|nr:hypothetical protein HRI_001264700 [Hibiscus trionum]
MSINGNSDIVGYRFHPTEKELVDHYLWNKILDRDSLVQAIKEVDSLFNKDPWELPGCSKIKSADQVWYFFSRRGDDKRVKRTTDTGFWKVTGKTRNVKGKKGCAEKKSLVFYEGRFSNAKWTPWVIHEYTFTSTVLDNKERIFLCKLKKKDDEKANTSPSESCQPSRVADEEIPDISTMFNPDEMLASLEEPDGMHELHESDNLFSLAKQPDGRHELHESDNLFSLAKQLLMHEHQLPCEEFTHLSGSYDELPHLSNPEEQNDDFWIRYLTDEAELYPDERSSGQVLGNEGCNLPLVDTGMTCPGESSRKRTRSKDGVLCRAIVNEECPPMVLTDSMMLDEHAGSKKLQASAMVNVPNVTLSAVKHDPHGRERMVSVCKDSWEMDAPAVESVVDLQCTVRATRIDNPQYQKERCQKLIEQNDEPKRIAKRRKFCGKLLSQDEAIDLKKHATAVNLPLKENPIMESNGS